MTAARTSNDVRLGLPKGRMQKALFALLGEAGVNLRSGPRSYRPSVSLEGFEAKILKPHNIVRMLHAGSRDVGFAGADWVEELGGDMVELLDTGLDPVRLVAAAPRDLLVDGQLPNRPLIIATEYEVLTRRWIVDRGLEARVVRSYGATEVFPPEDADGIVDNTATGSTLRSNGLEIVDELMRSSTRFYANPRALEDPVRRERIEHLVLLIQSVLEARRRVTLEVNVSTDKLDALVALLPCMREPTVASLHAGAGYAVKVAVPREDVPALIPRIKASGGTDIVVLSPTQIVP